MITLEKFIATIDAHPLLGLAVTALILYILIKGGIDSQKGVNLPWIGLREGQLFALTRATWQSVGMGREWLQDAYSKYSLKGQAYIFPDISGRHEIVIPNDQLRWLTDKPDHVASVGRAHYDMLQGDYAFTDPYLLHDLYHERVVHKNLARKLDALIPNLQDELEACFEESWGNDTVNFRDISVWDNVMWVISRASNRMFVGKPLCRNVEFLKNNSAFAMDVIVTISLMPFFPSIFHPVIGRLLNLPNRYHAWQVKKIVMPHIKQRLADIEAADSNSGSKVEIPEDYITWHIRTARADGNMKELDPAIIAKRLMPIEFAAIHTTALTVTMAIFDLFSSDPEKKHIEGLREEVERLFAECGGKWDKPTLAKMYRVDSAIRESMRLSTFLTRGLQRKILAKGGLKHEEAGWTAPEGSFVCFDVHSRHHDPNIYPAPFEYDAFRFSRSREQYEATHADRSNNDEYLKMKNLSMISTGENFLPFGHGRHACPGRFFVQHEVKIILAHILMNYEVPLLPKRPENRWLGTSILPPAAAKLQIRRRPGMVG